MAQIFPRSANWAAKASILAGILVAASVLGVLLNINRIRFVNKVNVPLNQPVPFSHKHHVTGLGIDCRYCHTTVEKGAFAGIPATETCMTCHSQLYTEAPLLEPVRASYRDNTPIEWNRVHDLPDFVYFNHSIHVSKGIGCQSCHGEIEQMPLVWKANSLNMEWCLECHREPEKFIRPREEVFNVNYQPPEDQEALGKRLVAEYNVNKRQLTNCSICHY